MLTKKCFYYSRPVSDNNIVSEAVENDFIARIRAILLK